MLIPYGAKLNKYVPSNLDPFAEMVQGIIDQRNKGDKKVWLSCDKEIVEKSCWGLQRVCNMLSARRQMKILCSQIGP